MVVAEIRRQSSLEMAGVQDDVVVETLPSDRADESLSVWIGEGGQLHGMVTLPILLLKSSILIIH